MGKLGAGLYRSTMVAVAVTTPIVVAACGVGLSAGEDDGGPIYDGETIEITIPFDAGGGSDTSARFLAPYLTDALEGHPAIQVVNIEGAGGIQGANQWAEQMEPDGTNVLFTSGSNNYFYLYGDPSIRYDYADMKPVMGLPTGRPVVISGELAKLSPKELAERDEPITFSALGILGMDSLDLIAWEILGIDVDAVFGYEGSGAMMIAFEQGEVDAVAVTTSSYQVGMAPMLESGEAAGFLSHGQLDENGEIVRDPAFPDIPTLPELYEEIHGEPPSGVEFDAYKSLLPAATTAQKIFWLHGDAPEEAVDAWNDACAELAADDEYYEKGLEVQGPYRLQCGDALQSSLDLMVNVSDEATDWALDFLVEEYEAPDPREQ